jgi:hypothetical protein
LTRLFDAAAHNRTGVAKGCGLEAFYPLAVFFHLLLFVVWLGGDIGVFLLGQNFRRRSAWTLDQRLALLKMLVVVDLAPRVAWALMIPSSLTVLQLGRWWMPGWPALAAAWVAGLWWTWFVLASHARGTATPAMRVNKHLENGLKLAMTFFYLALGGLSLTLGYPLGADWLAWKALLFGLIFLAAIMIDLRFKPVGPLLQRLVAEGSSDATELPLLAAMNRTRRWVLTIYLLLLGTAFLGNVKPF